MKTLLFSLTLIISGLTSLQAQFNENPILNLENEDKKRLNWGYYLGFNQYDFKVDFSDLPTNINDLYVIKNIGFNVGLIGELRLNDYFDLRFEPGLHYAQREIQFPNSIESDQLWDFRSAYIHLPLLLKASTKRLGNIKPFIVGGASYSYNLTNQSDPDDFIIRKNNYYWEVGFGIDIYMRYFKFSPSIRGAFAFKNEIHPNPKKPQSYGMLQNVTGAYTRAIFVNFTFE